MTHDETQCQVFRYAPWREGELNIDLITPEHFDRLPSGTVLTSIAGVRVTKGVDRISSDTRYGFMCYGLSGRADGDGVYEGPFRSE